MQRAVQWPIEVLSSRGLVVARSLCCMHAPFVGVSTCMYSVHSMPIHPRSLVASPWINYVHCPHGGGWAMWAPLTTSTLRNKASQPASQSQPKTCTSVTALGIAHLVWSFSSLCEMSSSLTAAYHPSTQWPRCSHDHTCLQYLIKTKRKDSHSQPA